MAIVVRLMNDFGCDFPIWLLPGEDAASGMAGEAQIGMTERDDLPLSDQLVADLVGWAADFNEHFCWENGWDWSAQQVTAHRHRGEYLAKRLRAELDDTYLVDSRIWECDEI